MYGLGGGHNLPIATSKWHLVSGAEKIGMRHLQVESGSLWEMKKNLGVKAALDFTLFVR